MSSKLGIVFGLALSALVLGACSEDRPKKEPDAGAAEAGKSSSPPIMVDNPGSPTKTPAGVVKVPTVVGPAGAGGAGGAAGQAAAGAGGSMSAAGSGGSSGAAGQPVAGAPGAAGSDPFADLFPPPPITCDGLLCLADQDCANLYPNETAMCKFTRCVDLVCKP